MPLSLAQTDKRHALRGQGRPDAADAVRLTLTPHIPAQWVWTFVLEPDQDGTRLISRNRFRLPTLAARVGIVPMEASSLVMERKMLRGIKQRAERLASAPPEQTAGRIA